MRGRGRRRWRGRVVALGERVGPLCELTSFDVHQGVGVTLTRCRGYAHVGQECDLDGANTGLRHRVLDVVATLVALVVTEGDGVTVLRVRDRERLVGQSGACDLVGIAGEGHLVRQSRTVHGCGIDQIELQRGGPVVAEPILNDHRNIPVTVDAAAVTTSVGVVLGTDGTRTGEPIHAQSNGDVVGDGVEGRRARRSHCRDDRGAFHRSGRLDVVERVAGAAGREVSHGPVTQHTRTQAKPELDDLRLGVSRDEVCP